MLFFLQLQGTLSATILAILVQLAKVSLFGLQDANGCDTRTAFAAGAGVHCFLTTWHSCDNLLAEG